MIDKIKALFYTRKMLNIQQFARNHRGYLVIVCDPKDDTMFMSYRGRQVSAKIKSEDGRNHKVVKGVLKHSIFEREIDRFIGGIMQGMKLSLEHGNQFYQFIDGALFNISKSLKKKK
uniref:Uncharacterized protein n=1 Tax=viral metagenome TaxID=1070528 RepID=A0A6H1ZAY3_9ZZZZ